jgi:hypothetical protein
MDFKGQTEKTKPILIGLKHTNIVHENESQILIIYHRFFLLKMIKFWPYSANFIILIIIPSFTAFCMKKVKNLKFKFWYLHCFTFT